MEQELISVITVCLNSADTIEKAIQSVLSQTYKNVEYLILDGGSCDGTKEIIEKYIEKISYYRSCSDAGLYHAMNEGIQKSSGKYVAIVNSDDYLELTALEDAAEVFVSSGCDIVYGRMNIWWNGKMVETVGSQDISRLPIKMVVNHPAVLVKKSVYEKVGGFNTDYPIAADYEFLLRCYRKGFRFEYVDKVISNYSDSGVSTTRIGKCAQEALEIALKYAQTEKEKKWIIKEREIDSEWIPVYRKMRKLQYDESPQYRESVSGYFSGKGRAIIFSAGKAAVTLYRLLSFYQIIIECFVDNDPQKWNTEMDGVTINAPRREILDGHFIIIANAYFEEEIADQLVNLGYVEGINFIRLKNMLEEWQFD